MNAIYNIRNTRYALSGALLGAAVVGLISHSELLDTIGAVVGGVSVFIAKARHLF